MTPQTLKWTGGVDGLLELVDQRQLPADFVKIRCTNVDSLYQAIKTLAVRGAPAIGVAAAYGLVLSLQNSTRGCKISESTDSLKKASDYLASSRPTAVNLFWAMERVSRAAEKFAAKNPHADINELRKIVLDEAHAICRQDRRMCRQIGLNGEKFIADGTGVLTHCNAGALATAGQGTALSVLFEAHKKAKRFKVYADETRPLLQGARLTAWELIQAGIETNVICDNMAGWLMKQGKVQAVVTGADRIVANGDAANKIGTYSLSILAAAHNIPFYIAAPSSTFDLKIKTGSDIPIELRSSQEIKTLFGRQIAPETADVYNPAFDVTDARNITAIITERGVIEKPNPESVAGHLK